MYAVDGYRRAQHGGAQPAIAYIVRIMFGGCLIVPRGWGLDLRRVMPCAALCAVRGMALMLIPLCLNEGTAYRFTADAARRVACRHRAQRADATLQAA